ncbi:MAG TPA: hypothetical protein VJL83_01620 [Patescibacteria group bacterium]|nr:hypothetical protein [Patescibacteria group bacterium]
MVNEIQAPEGRIFDHNGKEIPLDAPGITDFSRYTEEQLAFVRGNIITGYHVDISAASILKEPLEPPEELS